MQCKDCRRAHGDNNQLLFFPGTNCYWLCYECIRKRILVFDEVKEYALDPGCGWDDIHRAYYNWQEEKKGN